MSRQVRKSKEPVKSRLEQLSDVSKAFEGWQPGREVLTPVRYVPTIFPQFDIATRVGGYPIQRIVLIHGPSNEGKTVLMLGLGRSFLERDHFYFHVDAEMTTPEPWVQENLGAFANHPGFFALRPKSYEDTARCVRDAAMKLKELREAKKIPADTSALFAIDSLQKLVPENFFERTAKDGGKAGVDPLGGRGGQFQAAMNSAWMKELVPLLYHCNAGIAIISRESANTDAVNKYDPKWKVGGGHAVYYDSSLVIRVQRDGWVKRTVDKVEEILGERIELQIRKTKIGHKDAKVSLCYFHTSNGKLTPIGFDRARDVVDLGLRRTKAIEQQGSTIYERSTGDVIGKTLHLAVQALVENPEWLASLEATVRAQAKPEESDELVEEIVP